MSLESSLFLTTLACVASLAVAGVVPAAAPLVAAAAPAVVVRTEEYDPHPQYSYGYDVQDSLTGDFKTHSETRDGDVVRGRYSLIDSDGTRRVVDYVADPINGFNAVVSKEPLTAAVAPIAAQVAQVAPVAAAVAPAGGLPTVVDARSVAAPAAPVLATRAFGAPFAAPAPLFAQPPPALVATRAVAAPLAAPAPVFAQPAPAFFRGVAPLAPAPYAAAPFANPLAYSAALPYSPYAQPLSYPGVPVGYSGLANPFAYPRFAPYTTVI